MLDKIDNYNGAYSKILNKNGNEKDGLVGTGDILITYNSSAKRSADMRLLYMGMSMATERLICLILHR